MRNVRRYALPALAIALVFLAGFGVAALVFGNDEGEKKTVIVHPKRSFKMVMVEPNGNCKNFRNGSRKCTSTSTTTVTVPPSTVTASTTTIPATTSTTPATTFQSTTTPASTTTIPATTSTTPTTTTTPTVTVASGFSFDDEFNGTALDTAKWQKITTPLEGVTMKPENVYLDGQGHLVLRTQRDANTLTGYSGGFVTSFAYSWWPPPSVKASVSVPYRVETRALYPSVAGSWSGLWMENVDSVQPILEFDVSEEIANAPTHGGCHQHYAPNYHWNGSVAGGIADVRTTWHTYVAKVWRDRVEYFIDGKACLDSLGHNAPAPPADRIKYGFLLDSKIAKPTITWAGSVQPPATDPGPWFYLVDYIRVLPL